MNPDQADQFIPAKDAGSLSKQCAAALQVCSSLMATIANDLNDEQKARLFAVVDAGGRVGLELLVDGRGNNDVCLVAIDGAGTRLQLATVVTIGGPPSAAAH